MEIYIFLIVIIVLVSIIVINSCCVRCSNKKTLKPVHFDGHHFFKDSFRQHYFENV